jgi:hypothetical protein
MKMFLKPAPLLAEVDAFAAAASAQQLTPALFKR